MPSDLPHARLRSRGGTPTGSPDPLARLADVLAEAAGGQRPTPQELAELLWLAEQLEPREEERRTSPSQPAPPPPDAPGTPEEPHAADGPRQPPRTPPEETPTAPPAPDPAPADAREAPRAPLHLPSPAPTGRGTHAALLAPAPPMLRHPLGLQRALRPLKRRSDAPSGHRLDEPATADRIARLGAAPEWWLPVLRPARERWLRLNLVDDTGPTMPVWRPLVRELHTALAQSGIFRTVTRLHAAPDGTVHGHGAHTPADGRTVTLVISDCMGPQWRPGEAGRRWSGTLGRWTRQMPVAVVQPLPEHLWRDTALPAAPGLLSAPHPAAPTAALTFAPYDTASDGTDDDPAGGVPLPVLEADPRWLANWAGLLTSAGGTAYPGSAAQLGRPPDPRARTDVSRLSPQELVLRFRATSSPQAFRLAGHLALGRPDLPVMRLVQRAVEADPRPQHLAEVILSGLLTSVSGPPGSYAFRPGVRALLLRSLPRSSRGRTTELLARVGGLIEERAGTAPGDFPAVTPAPGGAGGAGADGEAIATVRPEALRRLTGRSARPAGLFGEYRLVRRLAPGGNVWLGESVADGERVALRLLEPVTDPARREAFLRDAGRLRGLSHPNVVAVRDVGFEGHIPYVAMEYLDGIALKALSALSGYLLPPPLVASVGSGLARAVTALHAAGVTHGGLSMSRVLLLPDGTVRLAVFEPGCASEPEGQAEDLRALCEVMLRLAAGTSRLTLPIEPKDLGRLPLASQSAYARAFNLLMAPSPQARTQGRDLLTAEELLLQAQEVYARRSYRVLGPLRVEIPGRRTEFAPLEQAVLAMLLLRHGRVVTHEELRAGLWGPGEEPEDAPGVLVRIADMLRYALGPGVLATFPDGCALHTSADYLDLAHCNDLERTAVALAGRDHPHRAHEHIATALGLWRSGGLLPGVPGPAARAARASLLQRRLDLYRTRAELDLDLGEYERAAADLGELVRAHPSHEDHRRLLLIALRHLGRIEEALEVYQEYEWSGGEDPTLLALGHELRGEYDDFEDPGALGPEYDPGPDYGALAAPDELLEGPYPTEGPSLLYGPDDPAEERPLPQDEVPESLFTTEDVRAGAVLPFHDAVLFECADGTGDADDRAALGRAVVRLLVASGLDPAGYELEAQESGWCVRLPPTVPELGLLAVTLQEFTDRVAETGGLRWQVTFLGPGLTREEHAGHLLDGNGAQGVLAVPDALRNALLAGGHRIQAVDDMAYHGPGKGWRLFARPPAPEWVHPVQGPFRLPALVPLPEPVGGTRAVVYTAYGSGLTLTRPPGATFYYEVDLTERRLVLDEAGPPVDGIQVFEAAGAAVWRISEPIDAVRVGEGHASSLIVRHLADCLHDVSHAYPASDPAQAQNALDQGLTGLRLPGHAVRWAVSLMPVHASRAAPPPWQADAELVDALRRADAVLLGFDGTLTHLRTDTVELVHRHLPDAAGRYADPLDMLRTSTSPALTARLEAELAVLEEAAAREAAPITHSDLLVRTLAGRGRLLAVVTDCSAGAAVSYLAGRGLLSCLPGGVHGRDGLRSPLLPAPDRLLAAARQLGLPPDGCLVIGSTRAEGDAAQAAGMAFVHVDVGRMGAPPPPALTALGLRPLLKAARSL
ncbi:SAV_2336 N-terminal domain-related protein [Streptomyces sp. NPDC020800]|uniref:SAV_2336 N-terminal domain-related protein n=1 Tax=Streptomyces sp. NPDC020800 TaxID=3365092 RepID=UPI00379180E5